MVPLPLNFVAKNEWIEMKRLTSTIVVLSTLLVLLPLCVSASVASADGNDVEEESPLVVFDPDVQHDLSITLSPIHLFFPIVELTVEYRLSDSMGVAAIGGVGTITTKKNVMFSRTTHTGESTESYKAYQVGAQFRYYLLGSFIHGMQIGAEAMFLHLDRSADDDIAAKGEGLLVGPFLGYKIAANDGFTFDIQVGAHYLLVIAKASNATNSASAEESLITRFLNFNIGYSF